VVFFVVCIVGGFGDGYLVFHIHDLIN
jgi:hypothetical protein